MRARALIQAVIGLLSVGGVAATASAQNALGDGRALDRSLRQGTAGRNDQARDFRAEVELRNAVVTGNVGAGKGFRGNLGYTAPNDFRGATGSDDLFSFERDAALPALAVSNLRGLNGLRLSFDQSIAGQANDLTGSVIINRSSSSASAREIGQPIATQFKLQDRFGEVRGTLRSVSQFYSQLITQPMILGQARDESGEGTMNFLTASPLQGVKMLNRGNSAFGSDDFTLATKRPGLPGGPAGAGTASTGQNTRRADGDQSSRPRSPYDTVVESLRAGADRVSPKPATENRVEPAKLDFGSPGQPLFGGKPSAPPAGSKPAAGDAPATTNPAVDDLFDQLRKRLDPLHQEKKAEEYTPKTPDELIPRGTTIERPANPALDEKLDPTIKPTPEDRAAHERSIGSDEAQLLRRAAELLRGTPLKLEKLTPEESSPTAYARHMAIGQEMLEKGEWFNAEERFVGALSAEPGDSMAAAGRVHAQMGAGMYRSAALNLRQLIRGYPELIGTKYNEKLLPRGARLDRVKSQLRERMKLASSTGRDAALLLAYLGFQFGVPEDIRDGFARLSAIDEANGPARADPLDSLLRETWMP